MQDRVQERIEIMRGDITRLNVDAIVNAANTSLLGGAGVDGAIHTAAGPRLVEECRKLGGCKTGDAVITGGYNLPARHVIHTVGPVWNGGNRNEPEMLASCYRKSLGLAVEHNIATIAFPSISTGIYGYPIRQASRIAMREVVQFLQQDSTISKVTFVCFDSGTYEQYQSAFSEILGNTA